MKTFSVLPLFVVSVAVLASGASGTAIAQASCGARMQSPPMSSTCRFTGGRRQGQVQSYVGRVTPIPVGSPCHDGLSSYGVAVADGTLSGTGASTTGGSQAGQTGAAGMSSTCSFTHGPRSGEVQSYVGRVRPIPVGSPCHDGISSSGIAVEDQPDPADSEPQAEDEDEGDVYDETEPGQ